MNTPQDKQPFKSPSCDTSDDQEGTQKQTKLLGYEQRENEALKLQLNDNKNTLCSDTSIYFQDVQDSAWQQSNLGEYKQPSLLKSIPTHKQSCDRTSQEYQFTQISETTSQDSTSSTLSQWDSPVRVHQTQEVEQDSNIQLPLFGEKDLDALLKFNPASVLSSNLKGLSDEDFELFLGDSLWQDTLGRLATSRQQSLGRVIKDSDYLSFPTLTSNESSTSRPAGQNKCEKWFKDNGLIKSGYQLGTQAIAVTMGFPSSWFEGLAEQYSKNQTTLSQVKPQAESEQGIWQDEQLHQHKQRSLSAESSTSTVLLGGDKNSPLSTKSSSSLSQDISIPCLIKQPKQLEVKGVIRKDEGDRFLVEVDGDEISVSKLFVYPDFSKSPKGYRSAYVGQIGKNPSKTIPPSKTRRRKGEGNGSIHWRTVIRNGREYRQAYYHWVENGKKRTKYIPKKLLDRVCEAESRKKPLADILILLGGKDINPSKSSDTFFDKDSDNSESDLEISPSKIAPPSKKRKKGYGTGYIECKPIKRGGNEYKQYWYHYEEWREGDRVTKKSKYISKRKRSLVEKMNSEKAPVAEILKVLRNRNQLNF